MFSVASTLANGIGGSFSFRALAALEYSGAKDLQWPHLQVKYTLKNYDTYIYMLLTVMRYSNKSLCRVHEIRQSYQT